VTEPVPPPPAVAAAEAPAFDGDAPTPVPAPQRSKRVVMVVDDSPTVRKILSMTLERAGYGVLSAADGEAALLTLDDAVPDLILLDISMPKLDGYEVCKRIKSNARTAQVPVVMLSGKDAFLDKVKGRLAGATEYLTKPFATPAVLAVVGRQFEGTGAAHG
jgi:twitching motility two-component system response regulator PilG